MKKGLIIGLASLGVGLALVGGVGGYLINDTHKSETPIIDKDVAVVEKSYADYDLPEEFGFVSYAVYDIGEDFAMFSSSSIGAYLLNKETKEFTFFNSFYVSSVSQEVNRYKYFWFSNNNLFKICAETGEYEIVALNSGVSFSSLSFVGYEGKRILIKGFDSPNSSYYFLSYDTETGISDVYSLTSTQYSSTETAIDFGDCYYLTRLYSSSNISSNSYLLNKESKELLTVSGSYLYGLDTFFIKNSKMYALMKQSSNAVLCSVDLTTGIVTVLKTVSGYGTFIEYENGLVYSYVRKVGSNSYFSMYAYYISFEDDSVNEIALDGEIRYCISYIINGKFIFAPATTTTDKYAKIAVFNEETKSLEVVYTALVASSSSNSHCLITEFNGKYYVSSDSTNFAVMTFGEGDALEFAEVSLKCSMAVTNYKVGDDKYLFVAEGIKYYDFKNDTYKTLLSGTSLSIKDISIDGSTVTLYVSNNVKYELNLNTLSFKAVAYWEDAE